jgi:hypothetical protein
MFARTSTGGLGAKRTVADQISACSVEGPPDDSRMERTGWQ